MSSEQNMEVIDTNVINNSKRINQRISNELRNLVINKMNSGLSAKQMLKYIIYIRSF